MSRPVTAYLSVSSSVHRTQSSCRRRGEDGPPGPRGAAWRSARLWAREAPGEGSSWASLNHVPALWAGAGLQETPGPVLGVRVTIGDAEEKCGDLPWQPALVSLAARQAEPVSDSSPNVHTHTFNS